MNETIGNDEEERSDSLSDCWLMLGLNGESEWDWTGTGLGLDWDGLSGAKGMRVE
jgi:hypothetical protein